MENLQKNKRQTRRTNPLQLKAIGRYVLVLIVLACSGAGAIAQPTITVDGNPSDWPSIYSSNSVAVKSLVPDANNTGDDQFTGGSQDPDIISNWHWVNGNTNDKGDITNTGAALIGCNLYFFGDRTAVNGDAQIGFWFFKGEVAPTGTGATSSNFSGEHENGDLLVLANFTNGGGVASIKIYTWLNNSLVLYTGNADAGSGAVNTMAYAVPEVTFEESSWKYISKQDDTRNYPTGSFFEGYVNLCAVYSTGVPCFSSYLMETRNSQSTEASLQDMAVGNFDVTPAIYALTGSDFCSDGTNTTGSITLSNSQIGVSYQLYNASKQAVQDPKTVLTEGSSIEWTGIAAGTGYYVEATRAGVACSSTTGEASVVAKTAATVEAGSVADVCASGVPAGGIVLNGSYGGSATSASWSVRTGSGNIINNKYVPDTRDLASSSIVHIKLRYTTNDPVGPCDAVYDEVEFDIYPAATSNAGADQTICEDQTVQLQGAVGGGASSGVWSTSGTGSFDDKKLLNAVYSPSPADITNGNVTLTLTTDDPTGPCGNVLDNMVVTIKACSKIKLEKLTNGAIDPSKTWSFTILGGGIDKTESVENDADGILFDGLTLSRYQTYTICESNVPSGYRVSLQYQDANGVWQDISWYDPKVMNGGGDFNQGEAMGDYCFKIGDATSIPLPANDYGAQDPVALRIKINNMAPPGGNARTPGYWKNWNSCTNGKQAETALKNGGKEAGFWLLDNHLPHILWSSSSTSFTVTTCSQAVLILDERQNGGKNVKMSSDAAYKLAKHLLTYQLNKKSMTYECTSAAAAATEAEALLAKYNFNGTASIYLQNKGKAVADYTRALELAKVLDAYNNNLPCAAKLSATNTATLEIAELPAKDEVNVYPTPFADKATIEFKLAADASYSINLYNIQGALIKQLRAGTAKAGEVNRVEVDGKNLPEGIYLARMVSNSGTKTVKLLLKKQ